MVNHQELEKVLHYTFQNKKILEQAVTHSSYANERKVKSNERMEFIGDSVLDLCVAKYLYNTSDSSEGVMTKIRATYVCEEALVYYTKINHLDKHLLLGVGEELSGGRTRNAILADMFEALLGAIFLDSNLESCYHTFENIVLPHLNEVDKLEDVLDNKSKLQELLQADKRTIKYVAINEFGPAHDKTFEVAAVMEDDIVLGKGMGKSKKEAEQNAARKALDKIAK